MPDWLYDEHLKNAKNDTLSVTEEHFWVDLIKKYLTPIDRDENEEVYYNKTVWFIKNLTMKFLQKKMKKELISLRDVSVFAFVMLNALFVLIVFLLQLNKESLHIQWPFNAKNFIIYDADSREITIHREYLELEPIGLLFVLFFGVILMVQFLAMLVHRFATVSQILATTKLDWYCGKTSHSITAQAQLKGAAVDIAKILQKPPPQWDENDMTDEQQQIGRRQTIHKILYQHRNKQDYSNLETNFRRRYLNDGKFYLLTNL